MVQSWQLSDDPLRSVTQSQAGLSARPDARVGRGIRREPRLREREAFSHERGGSSSAYDFVVHLIVCFPQTLVVTVRNDVAHLVFSAEHIYLFIFFLIFHHARLPLQLPPAVRSEGRRRRAEPQRVRAPCDDGAEAPRGAPQNLDHGLVVLNNCSSTQGIRVSLRLETPVTSLSLSLSLCLPLPLSLSHSHTHNTHAHAHACTTTPTHTHKHTYKYSLTHCHNTHTHTQHTFTSTLSHSHTSTHSHTTHKHTHNNNNNDDDNINNKQTNKQTKPKQPNQTNQPNQPTKPTNQPNKQTNKQKQYVCACVCD